MISKSPISPIPSWELERPYFDFEYVDIKKLENPNLLSSIVKEHLYEKYSNHFQVFTDGSVLENDNAGSGFVIPAFNMEKSFFLGKGISIFSAELVALVMALHFIVSLSMNIFQTVICVDSKSVIQALMSVSNKVRPELITEIKYLINCLIVRGTIVTICWVPSHLGIKYNDYADRAAKSGAECTSNTTSLNLKLSSSECKSIFKKVFFDQSSMKSSVNLNLFGSPRSLNSLRLRLLLNAWRTKFVPSVNCICGGKIDIKHILVDCDQLKVNFRDLVPVSAIQQSSEVTLKQLLSNNLDDYPVLPLLQALYNSPIYQYL